MRRLRPACRALVQTLPVRVEALVAQNSFPSGSRITVQVSGLSTEAGSCRSSKEFATVRTCLWLRSGGAAEIDILSLDRPGCPAGRVLIFPVQVGMGDHLLRRGRSPFSLVLRRVGILDQDRVVPPGERAVEGRADARIGVCACDNKSPDAEFRQHGFEGGEFEGVAVTLLDQWLGVVRSQLRDDLPVVTPSGKVVVEVLDPDNGDLLPACFFDNAANVRGDRVALVSSLDDAIL